MATICRKATSLCRFILITPWCGSSSTSSARLVVVVAVLAATNGAEVAPPPSFTTLPTDGGESTTSTVGSNLEGEFVPHETREVPPTTRPLRFPGEETEVEVFTDVSVGT